MGGPVLSPVHVPPSHRAIALSLAASGCAAAGLAFPGNLTLRSGSASLNLSTASAEDGAGGSPPSHPLFQNLGGCGGHNG